MVQADCPFALSRNDETSELSPLRPPASWCLSVQTNEKNPSPEQERNKKVISMENSAREYVISHPHSMKT